VRPPFFSQHTAIWLSPENQTKEYKILRELADALSRYRYVYVQFPTEQRLAQPFYWKGMDLHVRYSFRLEELRNWRERDGDGTAALENALRTGMGRDSRRRLRSAEAGGITVRPCSPEEMLRLYRQTLAARGLRKNEAETACLARLIAVAQQRRQGLLWGGYDAAGRLQAAAFVAWQGRTAFYVAGGSLKRQPPHTHAQTRVLFKAIEHCSGFCDIFDFEGSMIEGIAQFFQGFGATPRPYIALCGRRPGLWTRAWRRLGRIFPKT
ncbi:MAG: GNAT family N-acetyltransferase, partial [Bacteroidales bacterium]|nr:GNAT family N-acetyltransferase [Bacteroidales bacterium]